MRCHRPMSCIPSPVILKANHQARGRVALAGVRCPDGPGCSGQEKVNLGRVVHGTCQHVWHAACKSDSKHFDKMQSLNGPGGKR